MPPRPAGGRQSAPRPARARAPARLERRRVARTRAPGPGGAGTRLVRSHGVGIRGVGRRGGRNLGDRIRRAAAERRPEIAGAARATAGDPRGIGAVDHRNRRRPARLPAGAECRESQSRGRVEVLRPASSHRPAWGCRPDEGRRHLEIRCLVVGLIGDRRPIAAGRRSSGGPGDHRTAPDAPGPRHRRPVGAADAARHPGSHRGRPS
jgi:hypothetical protein